MVNFHTSPWQCDPNFREYQEYQIAKINKNIELFRLNRLLFIVLVQILGDFKFIRKLIVQPHYDKNTQNSAKKPTNV